jgi:ribulose-5-phosphate 4-epimerase/fuculose-1-phosphate aldolase
MENVPDSNVESFIEAGHRAAERGLLCCSSGNLSQRIDGERMLATASRSWLGRLTRGQISLCRIRDGQLLAGPKPTVEIVFHAGILRERPEVNTVLHFQSPCATTLACLPQKGLNYFVIPEIPFYIGPVGYVPYLTPGTIKLARAVIDGIREHDLVMIGNHGLVTVACDYDHALQNAEFFELACRIILQGGRNVKPIPKALARELLALRKNAQTSAV